MGEAVARTTDPALGRIKLAWWREQLEALDHSVPPAEPRLQAVSRSLLPLGLSGADLANLEPGWATLLDEESDPGLIAGRGSALFEMGGKLLGGKDSRLADAGALYALASRGAESEPYRQRLRGHRFPPALRPLTMLAQAAVRNSGGRLTALTMLAHRWSGRIG